MSSFKLLDLFSGAGGSAKGYQRAGFYVMGIDNRPQPHYCGDEFHQADAFEYCRKYGREFDAIHASPPCQAYTGVQALGKARNGGYREHPDLIDPVRRMLIETGKPFIIENVPQSPINAVLIMCGTMFDLKVYRHRYFETNVMMFQPQHFPHHDQTPTPGLGLSPKGFISVCGSGGVKGMNAKQIVETWSSSMGIDWMDRRELAQAIPPAFTEFIGKQMMQYIRSRE